MIATLLKEGFGKEYFLNQNLNIEMLKTSIEIFVLSSQEKNKKDLLLNNI